MHSPDSASGKHECVQCSILKQRMKRQFNQSFHRHSPSASRSATPTKERVTPTKQRVTPTKESVTPTKESVTPTKESVTPTLAYRREIPAVCSPPSARVTPVSPSHPAHSSIMSLELPLTSSLFLLASVLCSLWLHRVHPSPFIDEVFHVPQARHYCAGNFSQWNGKITTPPGLYLSSYLLYTPIDLLTSGQFCPHLFSLRLTNALYSLGNFILFYLIFRARDANFPPKASVGVHLVQSASLALLPPLYFFSFLYYTDCGSMFWIIFTYYLHLCKRHNWAALSGLVSMFFRQTNVIWIFFFAAHSAIEVAYQLHSEIYSYRRMHFTFPHRRVSFRAHQCSLHNPPYLACALAEFTRLVLAQCYGYLLDGLAFLLFLFWNQGIVLGDRSAHYSVLHLAQVPYLLTFSLLFGLPLLLPRLELPSRRSLLQCGLLTLAMSVCLSPPFTWIHPYLVADNRHYVFYLFRRVWHRTPLWTRHLPSPLYALTLTSMLSQCHFPLHHTPSRNWPHPSTLLRSLFVLCTLAVVVPQRLIEFRYFLVPYVLWRLSVHPPPTPAMALCELALHTTTNLATMAIFATKTFQFSDSTETQRIIW